MELKQRKYKKEQVIAMLDAYGKRYESIIKEQRTKITELAKEKTQLLSVIESVGDKEKLVYLTLARAEKTAMELEEQAKLEYSLEIERLKKFAEKWNEYFKALKDKYPLYPTIQNASDACDVVLSFDDEIDAKQAMAELDNIITKSESVEDSKARDYLVATSDNGFSLEEVLNPGELKLEELCKELGLIEEE